MSVILFMGGFLPQCMLGDPPTRETPTKETPLPGRPPLPRRPPCQGDPPCPPAKEAPPARETSLPRRPPSRPTPKGEIEEDQVQAHTQGGNRGGSDPGPHPRGKLRGIRSRPTSKGEIQGDQVQANNQGDDYCCGRYASYWYTFLFKVCK